MNDSDTAWSIYVKPEGCAADLATSILTYPVLSPATYHNWLDNDVAISESSDDTIVVTEFGSDGYKYSFYIDTTRWLITRLKKSIGTYDSYNGIISYEFADSLYVLDKIAFDGDTSFESGGYRFNVVSINDSISDTLFISSINRFQQISPLLPASIRISNELLTIAFTNGVVGRTISIYDMKGRTIFTSALTAHERKFTWKGNDSNGNWTGPGMYILKWTEGKKAYHIGFSWQ